MLNKLVDLYIAGGFVMPPLLIGAGIMWFSMTHRILLLSKGDTGIFKSFCSEITNFVNKGKTKEDALLYLGVKEEEMNQYKNLIKSVVIVAPLLGLLGTVSGMIETFDSLAEMSLFSQSGGIAGGISQALITTQMGLAVAIPGLIVGNLLERRQSSLLNDMEEKIERTWSKMKGVSNA